MHEIITFWQRSITAELCWLTREGAVGIPVVPLLWQGSPCVALPLAHLDTIDTLTDGVAVFSVTDTTLLGERTAAIAVTGRVEITHDVDGAIFAGELLEEEAVKHPPTRLRAGSLLQRRENWWWVPRILVSLAEDLETRRLPARTRANDALLVRRTGARPRVDVVTARDWPTAPGSRVEVWSRDGRALEETPSRAFAFGHQHSPDFERWERWYRAGKLRGDTLTVTESAGAPHETVHPFGMLARLRNHRQVQRACRAGIAALERRTGR